MEGETLAKRLEKGALPLEQALKLGAQIADALDKAHRSGVRRLLVNGMICVTTRNLARPIFLVVLLLEYRCFRSMEKHHALRYGATHIPGSGVPWFHSLLCCLAYPPRAIGGADA